MRDGIAELRNESAANRTENAELRTTVEALERTDRERDGLLDDLITWARATIYWIADRIPNNEDRPQLSQRATHHVKRQDGPPP